jgi:leucyl aminopeptidase
MTWWFFLLPPKVCRNKGIQVPDLVVHLVTTEETKALPTGASRPLETQCFAGDLGQVAIVTHPEMTLFVGLGPTMTPRAVRRALPPAISRLAQGSSVAVLGNLSGVEGLVAVILDSAGLAPESIGGHDSIVSSAVSRARKWTNASGADLNPDAFVGLAHAVAAEHDLDITVRRLNELVADGFGGIVSVGQASRYEPCLIDVRYAPEAPRARIALVGKGITFDTGGLSLKRPDQMMGMRMDKAGAAVVLAVISAAAALRLPVELRGLLPIAENMVGPSATRPGDVVTARNGVAIRVMDTDFEGRVVMADAISFAGEENPDMIIDVATLTYQVAVALGNDIAGLFSNSDDLAQSLLDSSSEVGEALWRLPLAEDYRGQVVTATGVKNHPESEVGRAITAALFLHEFVSPGTKWAHLDCTGPAWVGPASSDGATGFGVETLIDFLERVEKS